MSLPLFAYLVVLVIIYLYPNSKGSVGLLWAGVFVLMQALLAGFLSVDTLLATVAVGFTVLLLFNTLNRINRDPFADAVVFQFAVRLIEAAGKLLGLLGIAPDCQLLDAHDSASVRRLYTQLSAQRWSVVEKQLRSLPDGERYRLIVGLADVKRRPSILDTWIRANHRSVFGWVVSGEQRISAAWAKRGTGLAHTVTPRGLNESQSLFRRAREDLRNAISLDPSLCDPYVGLLTIAMTEHEPRTKLWDLFAKVKVLSAEHYAAHVAMVIALTVKWGGEPDEALEFARVTVSNAPARSALSGVLAVAHIERWLQLDIDESEFDREMYFRTSAVQEELIAAYDSIKTPDLLNNPEPLGSDYTQALNAFAFCFFKGGQFSLTREIMVRLRGDFVEYPWQYCVDPLMATFDTAFAIDHVIKIINNSPQESNDIGVSSDCGLTHR